MKAIYAPTMRYIYVNACVYLHVYGDCQKSLCLKVKAKVSSILLLKRSTRKGPYSGTDCFPNYVFFVIAVPQTRASLVEYALHPQSYTQQTQILFTMSEGTLPTIQKQDVWKNHPANLPARKMLSDNFRHCWGSNRECLVFQLVYQCFFGDCYIYIYIHTRMYMDIVDVFVDVRVYI